MNVFLLILKVTEYTNTKYENINVGWFCVSKSTHVRK